MSSSGRARRAAEQQQWQRELEGARSLPCQSRSRMLLNSRNALEHQLAAAEQPAATPRSRRGKKSTFVRVPRTPTGTSYEYGFTTIETSHSFHLGVRLAEV